MSSRYPRLLGFAVAAFLPLTAFAQAQLQPLWQLDPGSRPYLPSYPGDNNQRGIAYNPATGNVLLVNRTGGLSVNVLDGTTGVDRHTLNTTGISGGTFALSQIAVAADGAVYAANLVVTTGPTAPFKIYRWDNEAYSTEPKLVYSGEVAAGTRWGDNIEIRGKGNSTQILFGQGLAGVGERVAIFTTSDNGASFTPTVMKLSGEGFAPGDSRGGVAFGVGDTFYVRNANGVKIYYSSFDLAASTAVITASATLGGSLGPSGFSAIGTWMANEHYSEPLLAAINYNGTANPQTEPQYVVLFYVGDPSNPVVYDREPFINPGIQNLNASGAVDFGGGKVFALDTNNGLRAWDIIPEPQTFALLTLGLGVLGLARHERRRP